MIHIFLRNITMLFWSSCLRRGLNIIHAGEEGGRDLRENGGAVRRIAGMLGEVLAAGEICNMELESEKGSTTTLSDRNTVQAMNVSPCLILNFWIARYKKETGEIRLNNLLYVTQRIWRRTMSSHSNTKNEWETSHSFRIWSLNKVQCIFYI